MRNLFREIVGYVEKLVIIFGLPLASSDNVETFFRRLTGKEAERLVWLPMFEVHNDSWHFFVPAYLIPQIIETHKLYYKMN
jgi:hypothetical protein